MIHCSCNFVESVNIAMHIKQLIISGFRSFRSQNEIETFRYAAKQENFRWRIVSHYSDVLLVRSTT